MDEGLGVRVRGSGIENAVSKFCLHTAKLVKGGFYKDSVCRTLRVYVRKKAFCRQRATLRIL